MTSSFSAGSKSKRVAQQENENDTNRPTRHASGYTERTTDGPRMGSIEGVKEDVLTYF